MPQLIYPGNPIAIAIEGAIAVAVVERYGFIAALPGPGMDYNAIALTALILAVYETSVDKNLMDTSENMKTKDKWYYYNRPPHFVAMETGLAYVAAKAIVGLPPTFADVGVIVAGVYVYNKYIEQMIAKSKYLQEFADEVEVLESEISL